MFINNAAIAVGCLWLSIELPVSMIFNSFNMPFRIKTAKRMFVDTNYLARYFFFEFSLVVCSV